ncbi:hypothetical protein [Helicobacter rodentium]|nr:hypothetical protein [Helicobacter rodentium]
MLHYRLPRKFFKFSRNDEKQTTSSLCLLLCHCEAKPKQSII